MASSNPKLMVLEHYESLVRQVDIHTEELLEKCKETQLLGINSKPNTSDISKLSNCLIESYQIRLRIFEESYGVSAYHDPYSEEYENGHTATSTSSSCESVANATPPITDSITVREYASRMRDEMLDELRRIQTETLAWCDTIRSELAAIDRSSVECIEKLKKKIFSQKFAFILQIDEIMVPTSSSKDFVPNPLPFKLYLFVLDFYMDAESLIFLK